MVLVGLVCTVSGCDKLAMKKGQQKNEPAQPHQEESKKETSMSADTLVKIGDWQMTKAEFDDRLKAVKEVYPDFDINNPETKTAILDELINQQLLVEEANKSGLATSKDIQDAVEEFRRTVIVRELAGKLVQNITTSEEEAQKFYEEKKAELVNLPEWHIRELVLENQDKAKELLIEILKGADFGETAKQNSISKSAPNGGDLGFISEALFPQMRNALLPLAVGEVSSVFQGPDGFYIVKVEEKRGGEPIPFDEIKGDILQSLTAQKQQQAIIDHLNKLKEEIAVEVNENLLK